MPLNPALDVGAILVDAIISSASLNNIVLYIIAPLLGGAFAAVLSKYLNPDK